MKVKGILTAAVLIAAVVLLQTTGLAVDLDYSGPINSFTGAPTGLGAKPETEGWVRISAGIYYDRSERVYIHDLGGSSEETVASNVIDGMIVNETVRIMPTQGLEVRLYRDGKQLEDVDLAAIEEPGRYMLEARAQGGQYTRVMSFTVIGFSTGLISSYPMPAGFVITDVQMSGENEKGDWVTMEPEWDRSKVSMSTDGDYRIEYECAKIGMSYTLQTTIDHKPPTLELKNVVNGLARGPVDISDLEEGCKIGISLNGGRMSYRDELTLSGDYEIALQDEAGNLTNYKFTILVYLDASSWLFFGLVVLAVGGTITYLYVERKRMRVR